MRVDGILSKKCRRNWHGLANSLGELGEKGGVEGSDEKRNSVTQTIGIQEAKSKQEKPVVCVAQASHCLTVA